jgi:CRP/FNR family transcriptional regulator
MATNIIDFPTTALLCGECPWSRSCVAHAHSATNTEIQGLRCSAPLKRNSHVFRQGQALAYLYVLRSGSAKSYFDNADGLEQIVAFHFPGDLLGFDAFATGHHQTTTAVLETAALCRIPFRSADNLAARAPKLWAEVMRAAAHQIMEKNHHALLLGQKSALARFASLVVYFSNRFAAHGCSRFEFNLSMPRQDIANYLALAVETVSRLFTELHERRVIAVERRNVQILSLEQLRALATDGASRTGMAVSKLG